MDRQKDCEELLVCLEHVLGCLESQLLGDQQLLGLQLLIGTLQAMRCGPRREALRPLCERSVKLCSKMTSKQLQSRGFTLCADLLLAT